MKWFALSSALSFFILFVFPESIYATITVTQDPNPVCQDMKSVTFTFSGDNNDLGGNYHTLVFWQPGADQNNLKDTTFIFWVKPNNQTFKQTINIRGIIGEWHYKLLYGKYGTESDILNKEPQRLLASEDFTVFPKEACTLGLLFLQMPSPVKIDTDVVIKIININPDSNYLLWFLDGQVFINGKFHPAQIRDDTLIDKKTGAKRDIKTAYFSVHIDKDSRPGINTLCLKHGKTNLLGFGKDNCETSIDVELSVRPVTITPSIIQSGEPGTPLEDASLFSDSPTTTPPLPQCSRWANLQGDPISIQEASKRKDIKCIAVDTAIGPISTEPFGLVKSILSILLSLSGGIAVILIIVAGFRLMLSQGNPEAVQAAREQLTSAIVGFLFIIFSLVILQVIGVDILRIPGFTK